MGYCVCCNSVMYVNSGFNKKYKRGNIVWEFEEKKSEKAKLFLE